ncbi:MAG: ABC transporter ATP-binding protein [Eubacteriales bacterium]|nr:ABC transporter ATP-binding protein [Eubacteriales bacterium]
MRFWRKKKQEPTPLERLCATDPSFRDAPPAALFAADLCATEAGRRTETFLILTADDRLVIRESGKAERVLELKQLEHISSPGGVGSVEIIARTAGGEELLLARATAKCAPDAGGFVRAVNRRLRRMTGTVSDGAERKKEAALPKTSAKSALLRLAKLAKPEFGFIALTILFFIASTVVSLIIPRINRWMVDDYIQNPGGSALLAGFVGVVMSLLAFNLAGRLFGMARTWFLTVAGNRLVVRLRDTVFRRVQAMSVGSIYRMTSGELMKRVNGDTARIKNFIVDVLPSVLEQGLLLLAVSFYLFTVDWRLALMILLPAPIITLAFRMTWRFIRQLTRRTRDLNARGNAVLHDVFSGIRVVKAYGMERREEERFVSMAASERDSQLRQEKVWALLMPVLNFLMGIGEFVLLYFVGSRMLTGEMTAGEMSQLSSYAGMIYSPLAVLIRVPRQLAAAAVSLSNVFGLLDAPIDIPDSQTPVIPETLRGEVEIDHVSFGYGDGDEVLRDVSLHIAPGEFIGLVGRSGVGKSTLINLLMRMYDVDDGAIRLDGVDIREIPQSELRRHMGVVLQENFLFAGSVWQNLTYAKPDATRDEVIRAAKYAGAHSFIVNLPDGYNTTIGERGYTLSGGERQRLAIARALLHDPKLLILDEATSALDTETEKLIQEALAVLTRGRTTVAIAHRLSTLRGATRLVVLDGGRVAETGTHDELMEKKGIYYGLVMAQREMSKMADAEPAE